MVYIDRYTYIQLQICIRTYTGSTTITTYSQIENNRKKEMRPFSHNWYYQPRLKGVGAGTGVPPLVKVGSPGTKGGGLLSLSISPGWT
jgi:hypothetical protein